MTGLSPAELRRHIETTYRRGGGTRPDVLLVSIDGNKAVLKDHGACDPWFARLVGPLLASRESRALVRLSGIQGVPRLLGRPDSRSLLLEYLPASRLSDAGAGVDWQDFFTRLRGLLARIHAQGVAHCDMRSPFNTLIDDRGEPVIVDFVAAISRGRRWNVVAHWVFGRFARADVDALTKLKASVAPELISEAERARSAHRPRAEQAARWLGARIRVVSRRLFTDKR